MDKLPTRSSMMIPILFILCLLCCPADAATRQNDYLNNADTVKSVKSLKTKETASTEIAANTKQLKIKILSSTKDLKPATRLSNQLKNLGYGDAAVDVAPRSNFKKNTVYFAGGQKIRAKELVHRLNMTDAVLKPLTWKSMFDLIIVAVKPVTVKKPAAKEQKLKIKVLSGDGEIDPARNAVKELKNAGHMAAAADFAPRSDFTRNTIYFDRKYRAQAEKIASRLHLPSTLLRPLTWTSEFDLIVVTVSPGKKAAPSPAGEEKREKRKEEAVSLREKIGVSLEEAHERYLDEDFAGAKNSFADAAKFTKNVRRWLEKTIVTNQTPGDKKAVESQMADMDLASVRIQILSKNIDLGRAKKIARQIEKMGYEKPAVDYALRSDLDTQAIYFTDRYQGYAYDIAFNLEDDPDPRPMRWMSRYDLIIVTGDSEEPGRAAWLLKKYRSEESLLKEKTAALLTRGRRLSESKKYADSLTAYTKAEKLMRKAEKLCEKSIQQAKLAMLEDPSEANADQRAQPGDMKKTMLSLDEALKIAVSNSARLKEAEENVYSAMEEKKSARAGFFPKGTAEYQYTHLNEAPTTSFDLPPELGGAPGDTIGFTVGSQEMYEWNVTLTQPLFTGFALISQYKLKDLGVEAARTKREMAVIDLVRDVKKSYFNLLLVKAAVKVAEEAVKNLKSHVRDAEQYYKQGMIPYNDLLKSKVALAHVVQQREKAYAGEKVATSALNTLLEFDINHNTDIKDVLSIPPVNYQLSNLLHEAVENRPELKLIQNAVKSLDQGMRLVKSAYYPKIAVAGYYEQTGDNLLATENDYGAIYKSALIVNATWDFFEGGKTRSDVAKFRYDKKSVMKRYETAENGIQLQVKNAFSNLTVADKNIVTSQESLVQAKENWRITDLQYKEQIATSTDVLDARTELTQAESNYYQALYGYMISLSDLERAMGKRHVQPEPEQARAPA
jgi:outer membrane protein